MRLFNEIDDNKTEENIQDKTLIFLYYIESNKHKMELKIIFIYFPTFFS
jgi:hypothetical protein